MRATLARHTLMSLLLLTAGSALPAEGARSSTPDAAATDSLARARELLASRQWQAGIVELEQRQDTRSADWNNLMGYAHRRADPPDLTAAERYYQAALSLNPKHRGALEYLGELRLQQGDLEGAEKQLAVLKKATFLKSEEFKDLQAAINRYKAAGNRYVPQE